MAAWSKLALSEQDVQRLCGAMAFAQGDLFQRRGQVLQPLLGDTALTAIVTGHWRRVDQVSVTQDPKNVLTSTCTCSWGPLCRHAAAVLLLWIRQPDMVRPGGTNPVVADFDETDLDDDWFDNYDDGDDDKADDADASAYFTNWLSAQPLTTLRSIASYWDAKLPGTKAAAVPALLAVMQNPAQIRAVLAGLDDDTRVALDAVDLLASSGTTSHTVVQRGLARLFNQPEAQHVSPALRRLSDRGLAIMQANYQGATYLPLVSVGPYLGTLTTPLAPQPVSGEDRPSPGLSLLDVFAVLVEAVQSDELRFASPTDEGTPTDLPGWNVEVVDVASTRDRQQTLRMVPQSMLDRETLKRLSATVGWSPDACEFAMFLLLALDIVREPDTDEGPEFVVNQMAWAALGSLPLETVVRESVALWLEQFASLELCALLRDRPSLRLFCRPTLTQGPAHELVLPPVRYLQLLMLRFLERLPALGGDQWYGIEGLREVLWRLDRTILGTDSGSRRGWWFANHPSGDLRLERRTDWDIVMTGLLEIIITGPLRALGLVELADGSNRTVRFRPTPLAAQLSSEAIVSPPPARTWRAWREGADILVFVPGDDLDQDGRRLRMLLMRYRAASPDGITYRITPQTLAWTLNAGREQETVIAALERRCGGALPADVPSLLREWGETFGNVRLYDEVSLIETENEQLLQELLRTTNLSDAVVRTVSPRTVVVASARVPDLLHEMERLGHAPRMVEGS